ncbi:hypothetical protein PM082_012455 [Marasmius tenuissimus]|nr:hypothetical protein PM082_012455 [Marasmius tenuissimus]
MDLSDFSSLETLTLDVPYIGDYRPLHLLRLYAHIVSSISSTDFHKLTLLNESAVITGPPDGYLESALIKDWELDRHSATTWSIMKARSQKYFRGVSKAVD